MQLVQRVGQNIRKTREAHGLSQEAFAEISGLHRTYISGVERGKRNPTLLVLERLAKALDIPVAKLLDEWTDD